MPDSIRQKIMTAVDTRFKTILIANGYETDAGLNVFDFHNAAVERINLPAILYRDASTPSGDQATIAGADSLREMQLDLELELKAAAASSTAALLRQILADLIKAIGVDPTWGGLALYTGYPTDDTTVEQGEKITGSITVRLPITYRTKLWDPYSQ